MNSRWGLRDVAHKLITATYFASGQVGLFTNDVVLTDLLTTADLEKADYSGYVIKDVDIVGVEWDDEAGNAVLSLTGVHFQPTGSTVPNVIVGWYLQLDNGAGGDLLAVHKFPVPINLASNADAIDLAPYYKIGQPSLDP